jgi:nucleoside-diphosphate-sugar epimerase
MVTLAKASDTSLSPDPNIVVPRVVNSATNALKAAAKEPSVKRFILTSSSVAAVLSTPNNEGLVVDESEFTIWPRSHKYSPLNLIPDSYDDTAVKLAWDKSTPLDTKPILVYAASKTESERESWKWVRENKPGFVFNTVLPSFNVRYCLPDSNA